MAKVTVKFERFVVRGFGEHGGHWGSGETLEYARKQFRKAGGRKKDRVTEFRFEAELPFAPVDREATEQEADCWCGEDGSINWIRCEREVLGE